MNKIEIPPVYVQKGTLIAVKLNSTGSLGYDKSADLAYSDYIINLNPLDGSFTLAKINETVNMGVYFKALIDFKYYINEYSFSPFYLVQGLYNLSAIVISNGFFTKKFYLIYESKYIKISKKLLN